MAFIVIYDANVLYPNTLRDLLIRIAQSGTVQAKWTSEMTMTASAPAGTPFSPAPGTLIPCLPGIVTSSTRVRDAGRGACSG